MKGIAAFDCETDPFGLGDDGQPREIAPFLWCYYDGVVGRTFWNRETEFVSFLREQNVLAYAHNGGAFDFPFLFPYVEEGAPIRVINGRPTAIGFGKAELRDSLKILPVALAEINKDRFDYDKMRRERRDAHRREIEDYCMNDCVALWEAVDDFTQRYGRHLTIGSASVAQYQEIHERKLPDRGEAYYEKFSPFYIGGRTEVMPGELGPLKLTSSQRVQVYDINSAYPWALTLDHGCGDWIESARLPERGPLFDRCFATITAISRGCLPYRDPTQDSIMYPRDDEPRTYRTTGWEIAAGIDTGTLDILHVEACMSWPDGQTFHAREFVNYFYNERKAAKERLRKATTRAGREAYHREALFLKFLLNNLYGKLATNAALHNDHSVIALDKLWNYVNSGADFVGSFADKAIICYPAERPRYFSVSAAASITGAVRAKLWRALQSVERPLYCDTDSIACVSDNGSLELGSDLGQWELEGTFTNQGGFAGRKLYALHYANAVVGKCYRCAHAQAKHGDEGCRVCECRVYDDGWKIASKGTRLTAPEILRVLDGEVVDWQSLVPTHTLAQGRRFISRRVRRADVSLPATGPTFGAGTNEQKLGREATRQLKRARNVLDSLRATFGPRKGAT